MAAPLVKTKTPGIYKRGSRYVFSYRVDGKQRWESCRTLEQARRAKRARNADIDRGEFEERSRVALNEYLRAWVERYPGTGRRGYREETRDEDRRLLERHALRYFPAGLKLTELTPTDVAKFMEWLCDGHQQAKNAHRIAVEEARAAGKREPRPLPPDARRDLADSTVRNAVKPLRAALATARREGLIRHNPATDVALPHREQIEDDDDVPRPFPGDTMELVVSLVHPRHRLLFELLAATGLRRSELFALQGEHLALAGDRPHVKVRQRVRRRVGNGLIIGPLKSRHAKREVPIPLALADRLRALHTPAGALVFTSTTGTIADADNIAERVLKPACAEAGVEWAGFHTFRHTVASRLFAAGRTAVQVQHFLGHHSPAFTLATYVHLLDTDDVGGPLEPARVQTGCEQEPRGSAFLEELAEAESPAVPGATMLHVGAETAF
jgi:integrase